MVSKQLRKLREKNALTHGVYGQDILLPWESREEFEKLLTDLRDEFQPSGRMEKEIIFDIAHLRWQKYRIRQMYVAAAHRAPFVSDLVETGRNSWVEIFNHLKKQATIERTTADLLKEVFLEQTEESARMLAEVVREGKVLSSENAPQAKAFIDVIEKFIDPLLDALKGLPKAEDSLHRTYSPESLEPIVRLEAMIDARIDKALVRLVSLKEYKRVKATSAPTLFPAGASTPPSLDRVAQLKREK